MFAIYILSLTASAALTGLFLRQLLASLHMIADFEAGILLTGAAATAYIALQTAYMLALRLVFPTSARNVYFTETASHAAALIFVPYLIQMKIPWPHDALSKAEPLLFLGAFGAVHVFFKFASFYASLRGAPGSRLGIPAWGATAALCAVSAAASSEAWLSKSELARQLAPEEHRLYRVGDQYADARVMPEGARLIWKASEIYAHALTFRWAPMPGATGPDADVEEVHFSVLLEGRNENGAAITNDYEAKVNLYSDTWTEVRIPSDKIPPKFTSGRIHWTATEPPPWNSVLPIEPVVYGTPDESGAIQPAPRVLLAGPCDNQQRPKEDKLTPNILLIAIDGLAASHTTLGGYHRESTPKLTQLASFATNFTNAFTPAPDSDAALTSLLTGLHPLQHNVFSARPDAAISGLRTLAQALQEANYATIAFTEGETDIINDLTSDRGFERGFDLFDPSYAVPFGVAQLGEVPPLEGSAVTVEKARRWIDAHRDIKFFVFLRLRELMDPGPAERYGDLYAENVNAKPVDLYDAVVTYLDERIGELVQFVRDHEIKKNTIIIITATHGVDFSGAVPTFDLVEPVLRVPLLMYIPDQKKGRRENLIALEDIPAVIAALAKTSLPQATEARDFLFLQLDPTRSDQSRVRHPVSVTAVPRILSVRTPDYRFTWRPSGEGGESSTGLYRVAPSRADWWRNDQSARDKVRVTRYQQELQTFIQRYSEQ